MKFKMTGKFFLLFSSIAILFVIIFMQFNSKASVSFSTKSHVPENAQDTFAVLSTFTSKDTLEEHLLSNPSSVQYRSIDSVSENANTDTRVNPVPPLEISVDALDLPADVLPTEEEKTIQSDRITYQDGFYHESINESIKSRIYGLSYKADCTIPYEELRYLSIRYLNFEGSQETGELICSNLIADDLLEIFYELYLASYPIGKIKLIDEYQADDDLSCADNNTSCFNYRVVEGSKKLSKHALGLAIDINPVYNPYVTYPDGQIRITPVGSEIYADRTQDFPYKIDESDLCYQLFMSHGFTWGGNWNTLKDYQHFQKSFD